MVHLVLALAVIATKQNKWRVEKDYTNTPHHYYQTGGGGGETTERVHDVAGEGTSPSVGQSGPYQELDLGTMEERHYESLHKDTIASA